MKRKFTVMTLLLICLLVLSGCACEHEWVDANCSTAKTCSLCEETEGAPLGHSWMAATCTGAKTCEICGEVSGTALGHAWVDATCTEAKACSTCALTEGEALGHVWVDATTEAPKTCTTCALTEGERIITDERFTTAATAEIQGTWVCDFIITGEMMQVDDFSGEMTCELFLELRNDGTLTMGVTEAGRVAFKQAMIQYLIDTLYAEFAASGYDQAAADDAMQQTYGMTTPEYAEYAIAELDLDAMIDEITFDAVYYVENGLLYFGNDWDDTMESSEFALDGDTLSLEGDIYGASAEYTEFTRVTE